MFTLENYFAHYRTHTQTHGDFDQIPSKLIFLFILLEYFLLSPRCTKNVKRHLNEWHLSINPFKEYNQQTSYAI